MANALDLKGSIKDRVYKYYVGIDIGYKHHEAAIIPINILANKTQAWKRVKTLKFCSDGIGINLLLEMLSQTSPNRDDFCILMEPTSSYYDYLLRTALEHEGYNINSISGKEVKDFRERDLGIFEKSDQIDSRVMAYLGYQKTITPSIHNIRFGNSMAIARNPYKLLSYERLSIQKQLNRRKSQLQQILNVSHPELKSVFTARPTSRAVRRIIKQYPTANYMANIPLDTIYNEIAESGIRSNAKQKAAQWKMLLGGSISIEIPYLLDFQDFIIVDMDHLELIMEKIESDIKGLVDEHPYNNILFSLPIMGYSWACSLIGIIGDINRFSTYKQFKRYMGFTPQNRESGTSLKKSRLSTQGVRAARRILYLISIAMMSSKIKYSPFRGFYERLLARNMPKKKALGHVAGKLAQVIYGCLKYNRLYDPALHSKAMGLTLKR